MTNVRAPKSSKSIAKLDRRQLLAASVMAAATATAALPGVSSAAGSIEAAHEVGTIWWNELLSADPNRARAFYSSVAGWTPKAMALDEPSRAAKAGEKEYILFTSDGRETAGAMRKDDVEFARADGAMWLPYIHVVDVDSAVFRAVQMGGKLLSEPVDVPDVGRMAVIEDLEGARVGLITPLQRGK